MLPTVYDKILGKKDLYYKQDITVPKTFIATFNLFFFRNMLYPVATANNNQNFVTDDGFSWHSWHWHRFLNILDVFTRKISFTVCVSVPALHPTYKSTGNTNF